MISRRSIFRTAAAAAAAGAAKGQSGIPAEVVRRHDEAVERLLKMQTTDEASRWRGGYPDAFGLHHGGSASGLIHAFTTALLQPASKHHASGLLMERIRLAVDFMNKQVTPDGNYNLLTTNFNSPPDTAFIMLNVASAAHHARKAGHRELEALLSPIMRRSGAAMVRGGIHTPNHRWVVCAALAQIHELYPDAAYARRIDQWLAEGVDIDEDGQYTERSTVVYNAITNRAFTVMAAKLKRPELLDPVRQNLNAMLYLLHPGGEVVTEISRRQDANTRGTMASYWFPLKYLAVKEGNGVYEGLTRQLHGGLSEYMEYPELLSPAPEPKAALEDYEKQFTAIKVARIRRGLTSATLALGGSSRIFAVRRGEAVINAVRFAAAFFGKGQFVPTKVEKRGRAYILSQALEGPYYQPLEPARTVGTEEWEAVRRLRRQTEVCKMRYEATVEELPDAFRLRVRAEGTDDVPLAIEINLREGGQIEGCEPAPEAQDGWILAGGQARYRMGNDSIRFGPGKKEHSYTQVRGAQPKMAGPSIYLTGYTPFDHTIEFRWP